MLYAVGQDSIEGAKPGLKALGNIGLILQDNRMSLCVAWRWEEQLTIASDSRISGYNKPVDCGPKIFDLPIKVSGPMDSVTRKADLLYSGNFGMCFSGQFLTAYVVTQWLSTILNNLQFIGPRDDLAFESFMKIFTKVHVLAEARLASSEDFGFQTGFLVVGACPKTRRSSAWLSDHDSAGQITGREVLEPRPFSHISIGSGSPDFESRFGPRLDAGGVRVNFDIPKVMVEVIDGGKTPSVGGPLQFGQVERGKDFKMFGTLYHPEEWENEATFALRGIDERAFGIEPLVDGFALSHSFMMPFEKKT